MRKKLPDGALEEHLNTLHLTTIRKRYRDIMAMATRESLSYEEFLHELLREEAEARRDRRCERLLKASKIPIDKNMDTFEMKRLPTKAAQQVKTLITGGFTDHAENVLIFGKPVVHRDTPRNLINTNMLNI